MSINEDHFRQLLDKYANQLASPEETEELFALIRESGDDEALRQLLVQTLERTDPILADEQLWNRQFDLMLSEARGRESDNRGFVVPLIWRRLAIAVCALFVIGIGGYFILHKSPVQQVATLKPGTFKNDAMPGNKAILTLANGQQLAINSLPAGHIQNTSAQKNDKGDLVYGQSDAAADVYNTLTIPRGGGKHELKLADGTLAILDAGSSIRFPVAFNGKERRVAITGQVYFEVVHKNTQPFYVTAGSQTIEDIGTHFNVNAFDGEVKTTLIEGSVKVNHILLKPGQQAVESNGQLTINDHVNESVILAWKNDLFSFEQNTPIQVVMNQLSRWYDMDVVYQGKAGAKTYHFGGDMPRYEKLSDVLTILSSNGAQFSVDGKKIIVYQ